MPYKSAKVNHGVPSAASLREVVARLEALLVQDYRQTTAGLFPEKYASPHAVADPDQMWTRETFSIEDRDGEEHLPSLNAFLARLESGDFIGGIASADSTLPSSAEDGYGYEWFIWRDRAEVSVWVATAEDLEHVLAPVRVEAHRLREVAETAVGGVAPAVPSVSETTTAPASPRFYKRRWFWATVASVVGTGVALPLVVAYLTHVLGWNS